MEIDIGALQRKFEEGLNIHSPYKDAVLPSATKLAEELKEGGVFPRPNFSKRYPVNLYTEACTHILIHEYLENIGNYEYSLFKDSQLPPYMIMSVLEEHPYLINLLHRNMTNSEWHSYRKKMLEEIQIAYGKRHSPSELEILCETEDTDDDASVIHKFHYFMGLSFTEEKVGIKYGKVLEIIGEEGGLLAVHISKGVQDRSIVMYRQIEKINKELILNAEKVKALNHVVFPEKIYEYDNDYEIINPSAKGFNICLCYDDAKEFSNCTFSLASEGFPMEFMKRYIEGACPKTLEERDIEIYLQEWFFERFGDARLPIEEFQKNVDTLQQIAQDNYSENIDICINNILKDERVKTVLINSTERGFFFTYIHGLKLLSKTRRSDVVEYVKDYLGEL